MHISPSRAQRRKEQIRREQWYWMWWSASSMALNGPSPPGIHALVQPSPLDPVTPLTQPKQCPGLAPWAYGFSTQAPAFGSMFCCHCLEISSLDWKWSPVTVEYAPQPKRFTWRVCLTPFLAIRLPPGPHPVSHGLSGSVVHESSVRPRRVQRRWVTSITEPEKTSSHLHLPLLRAQEEGSCNWSSPND